MGEETKEKLEKMRKHARSETQTPVRFNYATFSGMGIIFDISKGGAGMITDVFFQQGTQLTLDFGLQDKILSIITSVENENVIENVFDNIESFGLILPSGEVIIEEYGKRN